MRRRTARIVMGAYVKAARFECGCSADISRGGSLLRYRARLSRGDLTGGSGGRGATLRLLLSTGALLRLRSRSKTFLAARRAHGRRTRSCSSTGGSARARCRGASSSRHSPWSCSCAGRSSAGGCRYRGRDLGCGDRASGAHVAHGRRPSQTTAPGARRPSRHRCATDPGAGSFATHGEYSAGSSSICRAASAWRVVVLVSRALREDPSIVASRLPGCRSRAAVCSRRRAACSARQGSTLDSFSAARAELRRRCEHDGWRRGLPHRRWRRPAGVATAHRATCSISRRELPSVYAASAGAARPPASERGFVHDAARCDRLLACHGRHRAPAAPPRRRSNRRDPARRRRSVSRQRQDPRRVADAAREKFELPAVRALPEGTTRQDMRTLFSGASSVWATRLERRTTRLRRPSSSWSTKRRGKMPG